MHVESGRLVLLPLRQPPRGSMGEFYALPRTTMAPKRVTVDAFAGEGLIIHVRPVIDVADVAQGPYQATVRGIYPWLYIGDPTFVSQMFPGSSLLTRAIKASASPQVAGAFKLGNETGVSIRFGGRLAIVRYEGEFEPGKEHDTFDMHLQTLEERQEADGEAAMSEAG